MYRAGGIQRVLQQISILILHLENIYKRGSSLPHAYAKQPDKGRHERKREGD